MSELKSFIVLYDGKFIRAYEEKEADKVIAELEESHKMEVEQLLIEIYELKETLKNSRNAHKYWRKEFLIEYKECLRHKYKRCLAMAKWCRTSARCDEGLGAFKYRDWYWKWYKRWLTLADKYKEGNV